MKELKTTGERVADAIKVLKNILEFGIDKDYSEYITTKEYLDIWIQNGEPQFQVIPYLSYRTVAHMTLPQYKGEYPIYVLKAKEPKKQGT